MTDIEQKALALVNELLAENGLRNTPFTRLPTAVNNLVLLRAIEQHEAFRQEVSDAVVAAKAYYEVPMYDLSAFIIAKPDPLVEAVGECDDGTWETKAEYAQRLRAAIEKRGGRLVWNND